jgi:prepilin-type N-terminal cleavage/methylation domain-containing protein
VRRATTSPNRAAGEEGVTLIELMVTAAIMAIVSTAVIAMAMRVVTTSANVVDRRDVLGEGRIALDRLGKQLRQAESVDTTFSTPSQIKVSTYVNGTPTTVVWKVTGATAPYVLKESQDGGTSFQTVANSLSSDQLFNYIQHAGVTDQVTITMSLGWPNAVVPLTLDVYLRNATS